VTPPSAVAPIELPAPTSVDKALTVLETLADAPAELSLGELSLRCGLAKPTAHRLLQTLLRRGYVRQTGQRAYTVGPRTLALGGAALSAVDYAREAGPALARLRERTRETIHLGVLSAGEVVYVEKLEGQGTFRMASNVGERLALHCTAIGKCVLAWSTDAERRQLLSTRSLTARTPQTIVARRALTEELDAIAQQGWAIDDEENERNVRCVGAPVFDHRGTVLGAVSVSAPAFELSRSEATRLAPAVMTAARDISLQLGAPVELLPAAHRELPRTLRGRG
jgi:IclR family acetate operon transcriptional repressor